MRTSLVAEAVLRPRLRCGDPAWYHGRPWNATAPFTANIIDFRRCF